MCSRRSDSEYVMEGLTFLGAICLPAVIIPSIPSTKGWYLRTQRQHWWRYRRSVSPVLISLLYETSCNARKAFMAHKPLIGSSESDSAQAQTPTEGAWELFRFCDVQETSYTAANNSSYLPSTAMQILSRGTDGPVAPG